MKKQESINVDLKELFKNVDFSNYSYENYDNADNLIEGLQEQINQEEVIYYSNAMKYLSENDNSLYESLQIADEYGYEVKNLNSELLATLLIQKELHEELRNMINEIEEIYENHDIDE